ncbi:molybdate ABC transporter substrate-binding protein [Arthrobacter sp. R4-81]
MSGPTKRLVRLAARLTVAGLAAALVAGLSGCGNTSASGSETVTVFAAASLKGSFTELARSFESRHPGVKVVLSFAGSSDLATQIIQGAPADVFASADTRNMAKVADAGLVNGSTKAFASNTLAIAVPPSNPASIRSFTDLGRPEVKVVVCAPQVPCGAAASAVAQSAGVELKPVSEESSVTDVLGKVASGEADAGLVYVTDVRSAGNRVQSIPFPESSAAGITYPIAALKTAGEPELADDFIAMVNGSEGQRILSAAGFGPAQGD